MSQSSPSFLPSKFAYSSGENRNHLLQYLVLPSENSLIPTTCSPNFLRGGSHRVRQQKQMMHGKLLPYQGCQGCAYVCQFCLNLICPIGLHFFCIVGCLDGLVFLHSDHSTFVLFDFPWLLRLLTQNATILLFPVWSASPGLASFDLPDLLLPLTQHYTMKSSLMTFPYCFPLVLKLDTIYTFIWTLHHSAVKSHVTISQSHILSSIP